jgi:hypothetical protein
MGWGKHVAHGEERKVFKVLVGKADEIDHWKNRGVDGMIGSECISERLVWVWSGFSWLRIGASGWLL